MIFPLIGGHYTYSSIELTPIKEFFGFERNNLDRFVHFLSGLLLVVPTRELLIKTTKIKKTWSYIIPIALILAAGALYEIIEWLAAYIMDPASGLDFVGAQGDIWDAQKDMLADTLGAIFALFIFWATKKK